MGETYSRTCYIRAGVLQSSVLVSGLYELYNRNLKECDNITTCTYADYTAFVVTASSLPEMATILQDQLNESYKWTKKWRRNV